MGERLLELVYTIESRASLFDSVLPLKASTRQETKVWSTMNWTRSMGWLPACLNNIAASLVNRYRDAVPARLLLAGCRVYWSCSKRRVATCRFRVPYNISVTGHLEQEPDGARHIWEASCKVQGKCSITKFDSFSSLCWEVFTFLVLVWIVGVFISTNLWHARIWPAVRWDFCRR